MAPQTMKPEVEPVCRGRMHSGYDAQQVYAAYRQILLATQINYNSCHDT